MIPEQEIEDLKLWAQSGLKLQIPKPTIQGISLRDWFAGQALAALITRDADDEYGDQDVIISRAQIADAYADAMMELRSGKQ